MYDKLPKYYVLKQKIIQMIENEEVAEGETIPSEHELIAKYDISRITVRRAIDELVNEGYLYRVHGKGTFVKGNTYEQDLFSMASCTDAICDLGLEPGRKIISQQILKCDKHRARKLQISDNTNIFELHRVYYADGEALNTTIATLPYKYFKDIEKYDFGQESLYKILEEKFGVKITRATRTFEAMIAYGDVADYLEIDQGQPVLLFSGTTYGILNGKEVPVEIFKCHYRTDKFKFYINQVKLNK